MTIGSDPVAMPSWAWDRPEVREALVARDMGGVFRAMQQYAGLSQARIAAATGLSQSRVNEVINGRREITKLDVFERIADGLEIPAECRRILGLAPARTAGQRDPSDLSAYPEVVNVYRDQGFAREEIAAQLQIASNIDVLAIRGLGLLGLNDSLLRSHLTGGAGANVRIMLLDPDCEATAVRAAEVGESPQEFAAGIRMTMSRLGGLPGVQVYLYDQMPVWRVIRLDTVMFVATFGTWEGHESAMYKIIATPRGPVFHGLVRHIEALTTPAAAIRSAEHEKAER
ncbi:helix-turn-helix transcriptional regulator [Nocardioides sp. CCNWLW239]|uniref:helix-turn-helix domain-containing protein n=1 Tax=Nocardioides sp. CCNWLW239 TaxID=3128902 RepID=UPI003016832A